MSQPPNGPAPSPLLWLILGPLIAFALYAGTLRHPLQAPDLDIISDARDASRMMRADSILLAPMPDSRPDLGAYRPAHGLLLKLQYHHWPGNVRRFHGVSLGLWMGACLAFALLASRMMATNLARGTAVLLFAAHPLAADAVSLAGAQGALLALLASILALWFYSLCAARRLGLWVGAPLIALCYFLAFGGFEAAVLLPAALLVLEIFRPREGDPTPAAEEGGPEEVGGIPEPGTDKSGRTHRREKRKHSKEDSDRAEPMGSANPALLISGTAKEETSGTPEESGMGGGAAGRVIAVGASLAVVFAILMLLRARALYGAVFPATAMRELGTAGLGARVVQGFSLECLALQHLLLPFSPRYLFPLRYEPGLFTPAFAGVAALILPLGLALWVRRKNRTLAAGLLLAVIGLIPVLQIAPLSTAFSGRMLLFALPGIALAAGAALEALAARLDRDADQGIRTSLIWGAVLGSVVLGLIVSRPRAAQWGEPSLLWEEEEARAPNSPQPLTNQVIQLVSRPPRGGYDVAEITGRAARAIKLAHPPDADIVRQYIVLLHLQRKDQAALRKTLGEAVEAPGPHVAGYFSTLGSAALGVSLFELAQSCFERELARNPRDFAALYSLADIHMRRNDWPRALTNASQAAKHAPRHMEARAFLRIGQIMPHISQDREEILRESVRALRQAIEREPTLPDPYFQLARTYIDHELYQQAEIILGAARKKLNLVTNVEIYRMQVDSMERQKRQGAIYDALTEWVRLNPSDRPFILYAARYLIDHGQHMMAKPIYATLAQTAQPHEPRDAEVFHGLGRIARDFDKNIPAAAMNFQRAFLMNRADPEIRSSLEGMARQALIANPGDGAASRLLEQIEAAKGEPAGPGATPPPSGAVAPTPAPARTTTPGTP